MSLPTNPNLLMAGGTSPYYNVQRSLRFRASASAYLNRTPGSASNQTTWTWSGWVKRGTLGARQAIFVTTNSAGNDYVGLEFIANDKLAFDANNGSVSEQFRLETNAVFRDPSAWYHIVVNFNTTNATSTNRAAIYINGVAQTYSTATYMPQNYSGRVNTAVQHNLGSWLPASGLYFDGYLSEINFIDGQALTPSSFGYTDPTTGVWMPKKYNGTYGTNGFYLPFTNTTNTTNLCLDASGNSNNWTPNNISVTSGVTYDSMLDVPTNWGDGGNGRGNYATLNPVFPSGGTYSNANLKFIGPTAWANARSTIELPSSGKWYFEATVITNGQNNTLGGSYSYVGVTATSTTPSALGYNGANFVVLNDTGWLNNNATTSNAVGAALAANNIIGIAIDVDNNTFTFYRTNSSVASGTIGMSAGTPLVFVSGSYSASYGNFDVNFGQRPFTYTPPSGFKTLNTLNLPKPTILNGAKYMAAVIWTGVSTSSAATITTTAANSGNNPLGITFQPDFIWGKARSVAYNNQLYDAVRGAGKLLISNTTDSEFTNFTYGYISAFNSNGFSTTPGATDNENWNQLNATYVAWQWNAGTGSSAIPSGGTVTPTGASINTTAGFSVITFTRTAAGTDYVPHGLGVTPSMIFIKARSTTSAWNVWQQNMDAAPNNYYMILNTTAAKNASTAWCAPSSTTVGVTNFSNGVTAVMYCWTAIKGFSAFGSYTGNGSTDGPFVYCGFRPRWIMIKNTADNTTSWSIWDTTRSPYNIGDQRLEANSSAAESSLVQFDILSNGFKLRSTNSNNASSQLIIYAAFAENPFNVSRAR